MTRPTLEVTDVLRGRATTSRVAIDRTLQRKAFRYFHVVYPMT